MTDADISRALSRINAALSLLESVGADYAASVARTNLHAIVNEVAALRESVAGLEAALRVGVETASRNEK